MSKTTSEEKKEAEESVEYVEAELASLNEEMTLSRKEHPPMPKRTAFVKLRIGRLEKELVKLRKRVGDLKEHENWLVRMKQRP